VQNTPVSSPSDLPSKAGSYGRFQWLPALAGSVFVALVTVSYASAAAQGAGTVWDGVYTEEQAKRGGPTYQTFCSACHGDQLLGQEAAPALVGDAFNANWEGTTMGDLFNRIRTTMPLNQPGALSRAQTADVVAFLLQSGKFPSGMVAFDPQAMGMVTFRTYRP
jgi:S-disulfanyl-L-cysteine oxidoreductase SoxD